MSGAGARHTMTRKKARNRGHIAEAAAWRLIGLLLERPRSGWHQEIAALSHEVRDSALRAAAEAAREATEGEYLRLVGPGGAVSPREVSYRSFEDPGQILAELASIYNAFAFQPHAEEPIDHIAVEVGFVGYLTLKEAFAQAKGDTAAAKTTAAARRHFLENHLASFAAAFAPRLESTGPRYLAETGRLLVARVPAAQIREVGEELTDSEAQRISKSVRVGQVSQRGRGAANNPVLSGVEGASGPAEPTGRGPASPCGACSAS